MIAPAMSLRSSNDERLPPLAVVRWRGFDGVPVSSYPLPRPLAEAVAGAFAGTYPRETFWVEDVPWLAPDVPLPRAADRTKVAAVASAPEYATAADPTTGSCPRWP
jgi:hypothetical protein